MRMTALQCDRFWSNAGKDGRQQGLMNKSPFPRSPRLGISLMIGSAGALHCSKAWMGLVEYLCGDDEANTQVLEKKSLWDILSKAENPGFKLQTNGCQHPLAQLIEPDDSLESSVDWSMREQSVRNGFNHAAELSGDATVKPIVDDIDIINNLRMAMDSRYLNVMDSMLLREEIDFQKLTWAETCDYNVMLRVDTCLKLQRRTRLERGSRLSVLGTGATKRTQGTPKVPHSTWVQQQHHKSATDKQRVGWQSRGKPGADQTHLTEEQKLLKYTKCDSLGHTAADCDPSKVRCRICKSLGHSSQKCDKLSDRKCLNFAKNDTCEYGTRYRFSHAVGVDESHFTDFDAEEQELDAQQVQDMVNAGEMDFLDEVTLPEAVTEAEESHLTDDISEVNDDGHHADDFIEDDGSMWLYEEDIDDCAGDECHVTEEAEAANTSECRHPTCSVLQDTSRLTLWNITGVQIVVTKLNWSLLESVQKCAGSATH